MTKPKSKKVPIPDPTPALKDGERRQKVLEWVSRIVRSLGDRAFDRGRGGGTRAGLHVAADLGIMRDEAERLVAEVQCDRE